MSPVSSRTFVHGPLSGHLHYIDRLRIVITVMVVAHHGAQAYAPTGGAWPVSEPERSALLGPFLSVNAGFFMGLFFLLSGYFVPGSLARKGPLRFVLDRLARLGVPLVVIAFGVFALIGYGDAGDGRSFWAYYRDVYIGDWKVQYGPLWFVFHLLVYSLAYVVLAACIPALRTARREEAPGHHALIGLALALAAAGTLVRLAYRQNQWVDLFGFLPSEPAHLPQYLILFGVGTLAGRRGWFETLPRTVGLAWLRMGLLLAAFWFILDYLRAYGGIDLLGSAARLALYPLWEAALCVGLCVGLVTHAREHGNRPAPWLGPVAGASYGVYLLHAFVVVGLNMAFLGLALPPFAKFLAVTGLTLAISFPAIIGLRRIPTVTRVL